MLHVVEQSSLQYERGAHTGFSGCGVPALPGYFLTAFVELRFLTPRDCHYKMRGGPTLGFQDVVFLPSLATFSLHLLNCGS